MRENFRVNSFTCEHVEHRLLISILQKGNDAIITLGAQNGKAYFL